MELRVGTTGFRGAIERYAKRLDLVELRAEPGALPRSPTLRGYRRAVPEGFVFSVLLARAVGELEPGPAFDAALKYGLEVVEALEARFIVVQTRPAATPSRRTERRLEELVTRLRATGRTLAWEPRGLWDPEQQLALAERLQLLLIRDLRRQDPPPGEVVYSRLLGLGTGARWSTDAAEIVAARLAGREAGFVVVEGAGAERGAKVLRERLADPEFVADSLAGRIAGSAGIGYLAEPAEEFDEDEDAEEDLDDEELEEDELEEDEDLDHEDEDEGAEEDPDDEDEDAEEDPDDEDEDAEPPAGAHRGTPRRRR
jgi:uncharacterized protein YecE (DUF72 family)